MTSQGVALAQPVRSWTRPSDRAWWATLIGLCGLLVAPLLVVDVAPLTDYPNHLARLFVLAALPGDPILSRFYAAHWSIIPNVALDFVAPWLIQVAPVHVVGRLFIAVAVLLPVLGTVAYNTALGGRWWALGVGLIAYNDCLLYGFLNFSISFGLALVLAAAWLQWRETAHWRAIALAAIGVPVLFFCHLMGLVFFGLLIGGAELFQICQARSQAFLQTLLTRGLILSMIFAAPGTLYALSSLRRLGGDAKFLPAGEKLLQLATTFVNYCWPLDMTAAGVSVVVPVGCLLLRRGYVPGPAASTVGLTSIAFLATPYAWKGTFGVDTRFAVMLGFMLFAGFVPRHWPVGFSRLAAGTFILLIVARMGLLAAAWAERRSDLANLRAVLTPVMPGQTVYVAEAGLRENPAYWAANPGWRRLSNGVRTDDHLGALVLIEHRAYWPFEFDVPSQQPIKTRQPYRSLAMRVGSMPNWATTATADVCGFDYVLLLEADAVPRLPPTRFRLLRQSGFAALYAISACGAAPGGLFRSRSAPSVGSGAGSACRTETYPPGSGCVNEGA